MPRISGIGVTLKKNGKSTFTVHGEGIKEGYQVIVKYTYDGTEFKWTGTINKSFNEETSGRAVVDRVKTARKKGDKKFVVPGGLIEVQITVGTAEPITVKNVDLYTE